MLRLEAEKEQDKKGEGPENVLHVFRFIRCLFKEILI